MGEARRRKKLLGSEYGKFPRRNSTVVILSSAKTNPEKKEIELSRPPIPEIEYLKSKLNSMELRNWVIDEWLCHPTFMMLVTPEDACEIASTLLKELSDKFHQDLNSDSTINYALPPSIRLSVGINVYSWTVWAFIGDRSTRSEYATPDDEEFRLAEVNNV